MAFACRSSVACMEGKVVAVCGAVSRRAQAIRHPAAVFGSTARLMPTGARCTAAPRGRSLRVQPMAMSAATAGKTFYDFTAKDIDGKAVDLGGYKGKVVLVVNVASQCGFTPQYKDLQKAFATYKDKGFVVLAFPCNQFGGQEPGSNAEIKAFAARQGAQFPIMGKVDVNGPAADPVFSFLKDKQGGLLTKDIKWNFTKFLVDRSGNVVKRYASTTTPAEIEADIKKLL